MKKAVSLLITFLLTASLGTVALANGFSDLSQEHWAYQNVMTLVNEGTVNGYEDGSFRPSKTVTRAEFVKMIGKWDRVHTETFSDLAPEHWAYEYIMWSGLDPVGTEIQPDKEMLRSDVINLIWKRNGSPANDDAPYAISNQGTNKDATSWAYTIGLIQGDDGYNLRLDSALTRAEAATLILRARTVVAENKRYNFKDVVSEALIKQVYATANLFDGVAYEADRTVTYGELARAAMTLGAGGKAISYAYSGIESDKLFEHTYTKDLYVLADKVWGADYYSVAVADKAATVQDALSALTYGLMTRGTSIAKIGSMNAYYSDCVDATSTNIENICLSYGANQGIKLNAGTTLGAKNTVTVKDIAVLLLLLDDAIGLELSYDSGETKYSVQISKNLANYPANYADYRAVLENIPAEVYNLKSATAKPADYYSVASEFPFIFTGFLSGMETLLKTEQDVEMAFTYYPSLVYEENNKVTFIVKGVLENLGSTADADTLFANFLQEKAGLTLSSDRAFYVVFETYEPIMDVYLPTSAAQIKKIIIPN